MILKPAVRSLGFGCPGVLLTAVFLAFGAEELFVSGAGTTAFLVAVLALGLALWVPFVVRFFGTRLVVTSESLELRSLFGLHRKTIRRSDIRSVTVARGSVMGSEGDEGYGSRYSGFPIAYFTITDGRGRRWKQLSTWFWRESDCEGLREAIGQPHPRRTTRRSNALTTAPSQEPDTTGDVRAAGLWPSAAGPAQSPSRAFQSMGCVMQGASGLFGFGIALVISASLTHLPMGRDLGATAAPGLLVGYAIGSTANLSPLLFRVLTGRMAIGTRAATALSIAWIVAAPIALWLATLTILSVAIAWFVPNG